MKKHLLLSLLAVLVLLSSVKSQVINKGDRLFGGSLNFFIQNNTPSNQTVQGNVAITPSFAWALKKNMSLGIKGYTGYGKSSYYIGADKFINTFFNVGPGIFLRKYREFKGRFGMYFDHEASFNYYHTKSKNTSLQTYSLSKMWNASYAFTPGVFYKFSEHFIGEGSIGEAYINYSGGNSTMRTFITGVIFLQSFNLGINYIIPKRS